MIRVLLALACAASVARADGGVVRLRAVAGPLAVTAFTTPQPLTAGPADVSVLVQDARGTPVLDASVRLRLVPPDGGEALDVAAMRGATDNALLHAAVVELGRPGAWTLEVAVARAGDRLRATAALPVEPRRGPLRALWPYFALPPLAMLLFALHQRLDEGRG